MKLYNSLTQQLETFTPIEPGKVSMYVCGPTVYNDPHIGNARPIVVFDTLKKTLEALDYEVTYVSNYTDVDDKIIKKANEENVRETDITDRYIEAYQAVRHALHADDPHVSPRVTQTMDRIIAYIQELIDKQAAYQVNGDVYFRVSHTSGYGQLSHQKIEDLMVGARIDQNTQKENPLDFTLWKETEEGIKWDSPWSKGRPGWHTECVVMIRDVFKKPHIDIHGGGLDLKFPHHENELAQCEAHDHEQLANYWLHNGMINVDGAKMAKSVGNVWWAKDLIEHYGGNLVRWVLIATHYRAPLNFNADSFTSANKELEKVKSAYQQANLAVQLSRVKWQGNLSEHYQAFLEAMEDDLNTPNALMAVFNQVKSLNRLVRMKNVDHQELCINFVSLQKMLYILGIEFETIALNEQDRLNYAKWQLAISQKDFEQADHYRDLLKERGLI